MCGYYTVLNLLQQVCVLKILSNIMMEPVEPLIKCFYVFLLKCQQASKVQRTPIWRVSPSVTQCHAASRQTSVILLEADLLNMMYSLKILSQNM